MDVISIYADLEILSSKGYMSELISAGKQALREICEATGGTYTAAKTSGELQVTYLAAASRLMLPPAN